MALKKLGGKEKGRLEPAPCLDSAGMYVTAPYYTRLLILFHNISSSGKRFILF
jgi:hypothetical protein